MDITGGNILGSVKNPYLEANAWGWQIDPLGFKHFLHILNDRYQVPLFDVENGIGLIETEGEDGICHDSARIDYHMDLSMLIWMIKEMVIYIAQEKIHSIGIRR